MSDHEQETEGTGVAVQELEGPRVWVVRGTGVEESVGRFLERETNAVVGYGDKPAGDELAMMVMWGEGLGRDRMAKALKPVKTRVPGLVIENGWLGRPVGVGSTAGYFQVCWEGLNRLPAMRGSVDGGRLDRVLGETGMVLRPLAKRGGPVLVCGQVPDDRQHGLDAYQLSMWFINTVKAYMSDHGLGLESFRWRPHPRAPHFNPWPMMDRQEGGLLEGLEDAGAMISYNSTAGVEAMVMGVPVVCDARAHYAAFANGPENLRRRYLAHLANHQWTLDELEEGAMYDTVRKAFLDSYNRMFVLAKKKRS